MKTRPRLEFDSGRVVLHCDGPWQEIGFYDFAEFSKEVASMWQCLIMWRQYPAARKDVGVDLSKVDFDLDNAR